jgi:hypothetical protein
MMIAVAARRTLWLTALLRSPTPTSPRKGSDRNIPRRDPSRSTISAMTPLEPARPPISAPRSASYSSSRVRPSCGSCIGGWTPGPASGSSRWASSAWAPAVADARGRGRVACGIRRASAPRAGRVRRNANAVAGDAEGGVDGGEAMSKQSLWPTDDARVPAPVQAHGERIPCAWHAPSDGAPVRMTRRDERIIMLDQLGADRYELLRRSITEMRPHAKELVVRAGVNAVWCSTRHQQSVDP